MQPVKFVRDYLRNDLNNFGDNSVDEARLRSHYILVSFGFEMILKSRIAMLSTVQDKDELSKELQSIGHDFVKISDALGSELKNLGIEEIELKTGKCNDPKNPKDEFRYFSIETTDGREICIEHFTDIRYSCMGGGMRMVEKEEHKRILEYTVPILEISEKINTANDNTR